MSAEETRTENGRRLQKVEEEVMCGEKEEEESYIVGWAVDL